MKATELVTLGLLFLPLLFLASCSSAPENAKTEPHPERQLLESTATRAYLKLLTAERTPNAAQFIHKLRAMANEYPDTQVAKNAIKMADTLEAELHKKEKARLKKDHDRAMRELDASTKEAKQNLDKSEDDGC